MIRPVASGVAVSCWCWFRFVALTLLLVAPPVLFARRGQSRSLHKMVGSRTRLMPVGGPRGEPDAGHGGEDDRVDRSGACL